MAKEEHERLMQEKRERIAAQQQATLEAEIALEELRQQRLRQREEAERLEGPFRRTARDPREIGRGAKTPKLLEGWPSYSYHGGTIDPATDDDDTVDRSKETGAAKGIAKGETREAGLPC